MKLIDDEFFTKFCLELDRFLKLYAKAALIQGADCHASFDCLIGWIMATVVRNLDPDNKPAQKAFIDRIARHAKMSIDDNAGL